MKTHHPPPHGFDKFIARARDLHGERFQYQRDSWKDFDNHVKILCSAHGWFEQIARNHTRPGNYGGCVECKLTDSCLSFLAKARHKHGRRFEYSLEGFTGSGGSVLVRCDIHGWRKQKIFDHLKYSGCFDCAQKDMERLIPHKQLIREFRDVHKDRYNYDKVAYTGSKNPVVITCSIHGDFELEPGGHKLGYGCKMCSNGIAGVLMNLLLTLSVFMETFLRMRGQIIKGPIIQLF